MHDTNTKSQKLESIVEVKWQTIRCVLRRNEGKMKSYTADYKVSMSSFGSLLSIF